MWVAKICLLCCVMVVVVGSTVSIVEGIQKHRTVREAGPTDVLVGCIMLVIAGFAVYAIDMLWNLK